MARPTSRRPDGASRGRIFALQKWARGSRGFLERSPEIARPAGAEDALLEGIRQGDERVCRRGGAIVTATWTAEGLFGAMSAASAPLMPPPPDYASPPVLWGSEEYIREVFGSAATDFEFERHLNWIEDESVESVADLFMERFPPMVTARAMLGPRFQELRQRIAGIWRDANEAKDGRLRLPQEYLLTIVRL